MKTYKVNWSIEIDADSPEDAAYQALEIMHDAESLATVFTVKGPRAKTKKFDIDFTTGSISEVR